jgi:hypothetical protein
MGVLDGIEAEARTIATASTWRARGVPPLVRLRVVELTDEREGRA